MGALLRAEPCLTALVTAPEAEAGPKRDEKPYIHSSGAQVTERGMQ